MACKSSLNNTTAFTNFIQVINQTFSVYRGYNKIILGENVPFSPALENIYFFSNNTELTFSDTEDSTQYDLMYLENKLTKIDSEFNLKFNFQILVEKFIYEDFILVENIYLNPGPYDIRFNFYGNYSN